MEKRHILSILVANHSGVLTKLTGLFSRRGYNIDTLSVGETNDESVSRITVSLKGDDYALNQIKLQLKKLHDVKKVIHLDENAAIFREIMLIKVKAGQYERSKILEIANVFRAKIIDFATEAITIEITGDTKKTDSFLELVKPFGILEISRTGLTALERGNLSIYDK
jgi:acetolactate synthase-1/3 small subunit